MVMLEFREAQAAKIFQKREVKFSIPNTVEFSVGTTAQGCVLGSETVVKKKYIYIYIIKNVNQIANEICLKIKSRTTIRLSNLRSGHFSQENVNTNSKSYMHLYSLQPSAFLITDNMEAT